MSKTDVFRCSGCGQTVDPFFYKEHIETMVDGKNHVTHVVDIKGVDTVIVTSGSQQKSWGQIMLDLPYGGRVRRDFFLAWSLAMLALGVLLGARII